MSTRRLNELHEKVEKHVKEHGVKDIAEFYKQEVVNKWRHAPLNYGIIGESGCGKTTFINTTRGLKHDDPWAARVDVEGCTTERTSYPHPENDHIILWDLPGVGSPRLSKEKYFETIDFSYFDVFIILSSTRFTENDAWLAEEIRKANKQFYFVRSKVDQDLHNMEEENSQTFNRNTTLDEIRTRIEGYLNEIFNKRVPVFLIDCKRAEELDFQDLQQQILAQLPEKKKEIMVRTMTALSEGIIKRKKAVLHAAVLATVVASAGGAAIFTPGMSTALDVGLISSQVALYRHQYGLDDETLAPVARARGKLVAQLNKDVLGNRWFVTKSGLVPVLAGLTLLRASIGIEEITKHIPIVGTVIASSVSFGTTMSILYEILNDMEKTAYKVLELSAQDAASTL